MHLRTDHDPILTERLAHHQAKHLNLPIKTLHHRYTTYLYISVSQYTLHAHSSRLFSFQSRGLNGCLRIMRIARLLWTRFSFEGSQEIIIRRRCATCDFLDGFRLEFYIDHLLIALERTD